MDLEDSERQLFRDIATQCPDNIATVNAKATLFLLGEDVSPCVAPSAKMQNSYTQQESESKIEYKSVYLGNNIPNPFTSITVIPYILPEGLEIGELIVADISGRIVKQYEIKNNGGTIEINMNDYNAGVYFYSLMINDKMIETKRMLLLK